MIQHKCPHCGKVLQIPDQYAGQKGQCAECGRAFHVPEPKPSVHVPPPLPQPSKANADDPCWTPPPKAHLKAQSLASRLTNQASKPTTLAIFVSACIFAVILGSVIGNIIGLGPLDDGHQVPPKQASASSSVKGPSKTPSGIVAKTNETPSNAPDESTDDLSDGQICAPLIAGQKYRAQTQITVAMLVDDEPDIRLPPGIEMAYMETIDHNGEDLHRFQVPLEENLYIVHLRNEDTANIMLALTGAPEPVPRAETPPPASQPFYNQPPTQPFVPAQSPYTSPAAPIATPRPPQSAPSASGGQTVYITRTGECYHLRTDCRGLNRAKSIQPAPLSQVRNSHRPCSICAGG